MSADTTAVPVRTPDPLKPPPALRRAAPRVRASLRRAAPALCLYAAARLTGMVCMAFWAWCIGRHPRTLLGYSWDGVWYAGIARHGYGTSMPAPTGSGLVFSDLAFFPLYPALTRTLATLVPPLGEINAGLLIAWAAAGAAAWGIHAVGDRLYGRRVATLLVVVWGLLPHAIVQSMAYTEPLLTALAAWSLYALLTRRWLCAGTLALLAGLSRPNGIAVAAAVCACAAAEIWRHRYRTSWRVWAGAALSPAGWCGFLAWVGGRRGAWHGYFDVQADWGTRFDFGADSLRQVRHLIVGRDALAPYVVLAVVGAALIGLVLLALDRAPLPLLVYAAALVLIALGGANYFASKPRFLLPAFPLLLPVALAMARARPRTAVLVGGALAGLSCFYGTYLLTVARIPM